MASVNMYPRTIMSTPGTSGHYYISFKRVPRQVLQTLPDRVSFNRGHTLLRPGIDGIRQLAEVVVLAKDRFSHRGAPGDTGPALAQSRKFKPESELCRRDLSHAFIKERVCVRVRVRVRVRVPLPLRARAWALYLEHGLAPQPGTARPHVLGEHTRSRPNEPGCVCVAMWFVIDIGGVGPRLSGTQSCLRGAGTGTAGPPRKRASPAQDTVPPPSPHACAWRTSQPGHAQSRVAREGGARVHLCR